MIGCSLTMIWQKNRDVHLVEHGPVAFLLLLVARGLCT